MTKYRVFVISLTSKLLLGWYNKFSMCFVRSIKKSNFYFSETDLFKHKNFVQERTHVSTVKNDWKDHIRALHENQHWAQALLLSQDKRIEFSIPRYTLVLSTFPTRFLYAFPSTSSPHCVNRLIGFEKFVTNSSYTVTNRLVFGERDMFFIPLEMQWNFGESNDIKIESFDITWSLLWKAS